MNNQRMVSPTTHAAPDVIRRAMSGNVVLGLVLALVACSGGSNPAQSGPGSTPTKPGTGPAATGDVTIRVINSRGQPVSGAGVCLNGGFDGRCTSTDASGNARFDAIPTGRAQAAASVAGAHSARRYFDVTSGDGAPVTLAVIEAASATPVILGQRAVPSADGSELTIEVDIAVLDSNGEAVPTLTAAEFTPIDSDGAFRPAGTDTDGRDLSIGGYDVSRQDDTFAWVGGGMPGPLSVGLLLDQSEPMADFDAQGLRLDGTIAWLGSMLPPDTAGLATYRGLPASPVLTTFGTFTSDGAQLRDFVAALAGQERGENSIERAVYEMLSYTAREAAGGGDAPPRTVVLVTGGAWDFGCHDDWSCLHGSQSIEERSRELGIPVTTVGGAELGMGIAANTGGTAVVITDPTQYPVVLASIPAIAGKSLGFNRVRWQASAEGRSHDQKEPVFRPGQTIWAYLKVRVAPDVDLFLSIPVPVR